MAVVRAAPDEAGGPADGAAGVTALSADRGPNDAGGPADRPAHETDRVQPVEVAHGRRRPLVRALGRGLGQRVAALGAAGGLGPLCPGAAAALAGRRELLLPDSETRPQRDLGGAHYRGMGGCGVLM